VGAAEITDARLLHWLGEFEKQTTATTARTTRVLAQSLAQTLQDLRTRYAKLQAASDARREPGFKGASTGREQAYTVERNTALYRELLAAAGSLMDPATAAKLDTIYREDLRAAYAMGGESANDLRRAVEANGAVSELVRMPEAAIEQAGSRLSAFWDRESLQMREQVTDAVTRALQQGKGWKAASLDVERVLRAHSNTILRAGDELSVTARGGIPMRLTERADLIARTELASAYIDGQLTQHRRNGYSYARWSATGERACPYCVSREGIIYRIEDLDGAIPAHPRCRCTVAPVADSAVDRVTAAKDREAAAARFLDDAEWTAIRQRRLDEYAAANGGRPLGSPAAYMAKPTNRQAYLRPGSAAAAPVWTPSGDARPNLAAVGAATRRAQLIAEQEAAAAAEAKAKAEQQAAQEEADRLRQEADAAAAAAEKAAAEKAAAEERAAADKAGTDTAALAALRQAVEKAEADLAAAKAAADQAWQTADQAAQNLRTARIGNTEAAKNLAEDQAAYTKDRAALDRAQAQRAQLEALLGLAREANTAQIDKHARLLRRISGARDAAKLVEQEAQAAGTAGGRADYDAKVASLKHDKASLVKMGEDVLARTGLTADEIKADGKATQALEAARKELTIAERERKRWVFGEGLESDDGMRARLRGYGYLSTQQIENSIMRYHDDRRERKAQAKERFREASLKFDAAAQAHKNRNIGEDPMAKAAAVLAELLSSSPMSKGTAAALVDAAVNGSSEGKAPHNVTDMADAVHLYGSNFGMEGYRFTKERAYAKTQGRDVETGRFNRTTAAINSGDTSFNSYYRSTQFHELGHLLEASHADVSAAAREFIYSRAAKLKNGKIKAPIKLGAGYKAHEKAFKGEAIDPYVLKDYSTYRDRHDPAASWLSDAGRIQAEYLAKLDAGDTFAGWRAGVDTEVVAMGVQHLNSPGDLLSLLTADPEHALMTLGMVRLVQARKAAAMARSEVTESGNILTDWSVTEQPAADERNLPRSTGKATADPEVMAKAKAKKDALDAEAAALEARKPESAAALLATVQEVSRLEGELGKLPSQAATEADATRLAKVQADLAATAKRLEDAAASLTRMQDTADRLAAEQASREVLAASAAEALEKAKTALEAAQAAAKGAPEPMEARVGRMAVGDVYADPERFQYKTTTNSTTGEVGSLRGVGTWNEDLAGILSVWKDPADGRTYVINGHNRLALAKRLGAEEVPVLRIEAATALEARSIGALQNIANGDGTAVDAARFMRDTGLNADALQGRGLTLKGKMAADGTALAALPAHVFDAVVRGDLSTDQAVILGRSGLGEPAMAAAYKVLQARPNMALDTLGEVLQQAAAASTSTRAEATLFGVTETETSNLLQRAELAAKVRGALGQEQKLLAKAQKQADALERGGNRIDRQTAAIQAAEAALRRDVFDLLKNRPGPVADALNTAADAVGGARKAAEKAAATRAGNEAVGAALDAETARLAKEPGGLLVAVENLRRAQQRGTVTPAILQQEGSAAIPDAVRQRAARAGIAIEDAKVGTIAEVKTSDLLTDAKRFQYKETTNAVTGEVGSLEGVQRWDANLGGVLTAWRDPADGKAYIINGHNRLAAARRLGADTVAVRFIQAANAAEARANGALTNIAEGHGTAMDAARFLRSQGWGLDELQAKGIPLRQDVARKGAALARLPEAVFSQVVDEALGVDKAAALGASRLDADAMERVAAVAAQRPGMALRTFEQLIGIQEARIGQAETLSLFGHDPLEESRMLERADLATRVRDGILADRRLFAAVATSRAADRLAKAGSTIDTAANAAAAEKASKAQAVFDTLQHVSGPIGSALSRGAEELLAATDKDARAAILERVREEVAAAILVEMGGDPTPAPQPEDLSGTLSLFG
jgi:SPP1 gp7 family putative phage head morphogenesis protein